MAQPSETTKPTRESIIKAYNELVAQEGRLIGERIFMKETGISQYSWNGGFWRSWSAFQGDAGHKPNSQTQKIPDEAILRRFALLAMEMGEIPKEADIDLKRRQDTSFPNRSCYRRWGSRNALLTRVAEYCTGKPEFEPVLEKLNEGNSIAVDRRLVSLQVKGFVYLLRTGKFYKLGRTNAIGRRLRELSVQLPQKPNTVHVIETDDPEGIEQYWHRRFADKRHGGEWFALSKEDVKAFKKRRFQ
jgi:hypothetical protein